jgi:tight adherence protein B
MSQSTILLLLVLSCLSLAGLGLSGMLVARLQENEKKLRARMRAIETPKEESRLQLSAFTPPKPEKQPFYTLLADVFGIDTVRIDQYPLKWWVVLCIALGISVVLYTFAMPIFGRLALLIIPAGWVFLSRSFFGWVAGRRRGKLLQQFPDALAMIVRSVGVGIPVVVAMRSVGNDASEPTRGEFARLIEQLSIGVTLEDALFAMAHRSNLAEYRFFAAALTLQAQTGGSLGATLEGLADVIRKRLALKARGHALASEARASATVLAILPLALGLMLWVMNPQYISVLFTDHTGNAILGMAVGSLGMGILAMRTIIQKSLS